MIYGLLDEMCADLLEVDLSIYIKKIESTTNNRAEIIINALLSEDENLIIKAKRIFKLI